MERGLSDEHGGIVSLSALVAEHGQALNYDLITRAGVSLYDVPGPLSWADVRDFVRFLDAGSALVSEIDPEAAGWQGDQKVAMLLAHIADLLAGLSYSYALCHTKKGVKKPQPPEPIPRPGVKSKKQEKKHWGSDAIPISEFDAWWDQIYDEED